MSTITNIRNRNMSINMLSKYFSICVNTKFTKTARDIKPSTEIRKPAEIKQHNDVNGFLAEHADARRFRGTKVWLVSPTVSPDYPIVASIDHTEDNGKTVFVSWCNYSGKKEGPYRLRNDDTVKVIGIKDAEVLRVAPAPASIIREIQYIANIRDESAKRERSESAEVRLSNFLKKNNISNKVIDDRVYMIAGKYYVECSDKFELSGVNKGVFAIFKRDKDGVKKLIKRIKTIENNFDFEGGLHSINV